MSEVSQISANPWLVSLLAVIALVLVWLLYRLIRLRRGNLESILGDISFDRVNSLVIPSADEGEIMIDYLLLTSKGLLILDIKDVQGVVFGGDKMQDWAVISQERRYTFPNPQPALYDRIAAVRQIVRQVPVAGRILFLDGAEFTKGVPTLVCSPSELLREFGESDKNSAKFKIDAFKPHWDLVRKAELNASAGQ